MDGGDKARVRDYWQAGACGEVYATGAERRSRFAAQYRERYRLEPYIAPFARFDDGAGKDVLEIGVGMGADHLRWANSRPRRLAGIDLTRRAAGLTAERLAMDGYRSAVLVGDGERLPFPDDSFDLVYSWGVLHHSPDTEAAVAEVLRVLRDGGTARIMVYHRPSLVGLLLWMRYALLAGHPFRSLRDVCAAHLESPGTQAFTTAEARRMFSAFRHVEASARISFADLLEGAVGQRHQGRALEILKKIWPRAVFRRLHALGTFLLIEARK